MRVLSKLWLLSFLLLPVFAQPAPVQLYDGRSAISGKGSKLPAAELATVKTEVKKQANHPVLKRRLDGLNPTFEEFEVRDFVDGSFTQKGAKQRAYLYRYSYTNGVVVTQGGKVVAHYSGDPGDYALYFAMSKAPDLNGDGLSDLVLIRNTEDTATIYAYVFSLGAGKSTYLGAATVFSSNVLPGEDPLPDEQIEDTAYRATAAGSKLSHQRYVRHLEGAWKAQGTAEVLKLENSRQVTLSNLNGKN